MNFPAKVTFKFINNETKKPVSNIAVILTLYAHRKNNYHVGPFISNKNGLVTFTKKDCLQEIDSSRKFYLMDYSSRLEECLPKVSIEIQSSEGLQYTVNESRQFAHIYKNYWNCSESFLNHLERCNNALYKPEIFTFSEEALWKNEIIEIKAHRQPQK